MDCPLNVKEEGGSMKRRNGIWVVVLAIVVGCGMFLPQAWAVSGKIGDKVTIDFHGYLESNVVVRDTDGLDTGFFNDTEVIQQRNTLKFDLDVHTNFEMGPISLKKVHLTYRGAYDSIFDLRDDRFNNIPDKREGRFNYGLNNIEYENDLREAFFDLTYDGAYGVGFLRPGRQLVSWGVVQGWTIVDKVNPVDGSFAISAYPDELHTPLWMVRANYSIPPQKDLNLNFDLVVVPDVRPTQMPPVDSEIQAPYLRGTSFYGFKSLWQNPFFTDVYEDVPTEKVEYGGKVTADIGSYFSVSGMYFHHANDDPGVLLTKNVNLGGPIAPCRVDLEHPMSDTFGGTFSWYFTPPVDLVFKGEFGYTTDEVVPLPNSDPDVVAAKYGGSAGGGMFPYLPYDLALYRLKDTATYMLGVDQNGGARWLSPSQINLSFQGIYKHILNHDADMTTVDANEYWVSGMANWYWWNGRINPTVFVMYDTKDAWMTNVAVAWTITKNWKTVLDFIGFWGDSESNAYWAYKGLLGGTTNSGSWNESSSQVMLKVLYQW